MLSRLNNLQANNLQDTRYPIMFDYDIEGWTANLFYPVDKEFLLQGIK
jgi:hypothetical protein